MSVSKDLNKRKLKRLSSLENKKVQSLLEQKAEKIFSKIQDESNNDKIKELLDILSIFAFRVSPVTIKIIRYLIIESEPNKVEEYDTKFGKKRGATYKDLIVECCDLLKQVRYFEIKEVLELAARIYREDYSEYGESRLSSYKDTKEKARKVVEKTVKYNPKILLNKKALDPQVYAMEVVEDWGPRQRKWYSELIREIIEQILSLSLERTEMTGPQSFSFGRGTIPPSEELEKLRHRVIDFGFEIFKKKDELKDKIKIIQSIGTALELPMNTSPKNIEKIQNMVSRDVKYIINKYEDIIFGEDDNLSTPFPLVHKMEGQFNVFELNQDVYKDKIPEAWKFLEKIRSDKEYSIYRVFITDQSDFEKRKQKQEKITEFIENINENNIDEWVERIKNIASHKNDVDWYHTSNFRDFLRELMRVNSEHVVKEIASELKKKRSGLRYFSYDIMTGIRLNNNVGLWQEISDQLRKKSNFDYRVLYGILGSISATDSQVDASGYDLDLIEEYVAGKPNERKVRSQIINALISVWSLNPTKVKKLIKKEVEEYEDSDSYRRSYIKQIQLGFYNNEQILDDIEQDSTFVEFLFEQLTKVSKLIFGEVQLLHMLGEEIDYKRMMKVFIDRVKKESKKIKDGKKEHFSINSYESSPSHINHDFRDFVAEHPDFDEVVSGWIEELSAKNNIEAYELSGLLSEFGAENVRDFIRNLIETGKKENLKKAKNLLNRVTQSPDFELCIDIIEKLDAEEDESLVQSVSGLMMHTGVVSGWDGIARAYKNKAERLRDIAEERDSEKVKEFCINLAEDFEAKAERELRQAKEERKEREIDFKS